ncbi:hypothetical protein GCM10010413_09510 [Promicromonospora sukumoe]|uniref:Uncharacterized protein n=1 Tax=Promicromonospora sukumoe TaxID=88382 RepID=A0A7W3PCG2_9MICO|nr:hypothetical protein [Promicromonospora sukumoe]MBA8806621.1 hypothetical protein [Promicromonospora sukumoe]
MAAGIIDAVSPVAELALRVLRRADLRLGRGLSDDQIADIQATYGFTFNRDHADVLRHATPKVWTDWTGDEQSLRDSLGWPVEGVLSDVANAFWTPAWGERPRTKAAAVDVARRHLAAMPQLVPVYGNRYIPAAPEPSGAPVFSAYQTDVIHYGTDLADYCAHEFLGVSTGRTHHRRIEFWSDLVEGVGGVEFW